MKVTEGGGEKLTAGVYTGKFAGFASRDKDTDQPKISTTEWGDRVYLNLAVKDSDNDDALAPIACNPTDGLATWFKILTGKDMPKGKSLLEIEGIMRQESKTVKVSVNDKGWVSGLYIPKASYLAKFQRFSVRDDDENPIWKVTEYKNQPQKKVFWQFEIVAGDLQGVIAPASCSYAIKKVNGELTIASKANLFAWATALGVDFADMPDPKSKDNVLPELEKAILEAGRVVLVQIGDTGWVDSSQGAIAPPPAGVSIPSNGGNGNGKKAATDKIEEVFGSSKLEDLYKAMSSFGTAKGMGGLFTQDGGFTDVGKTFCKDVLAPICDEGGVPRKFASMQEPHIEYLIQRLKIEEEELAAKSAATAGSAKEDLPF